MSASEQAARKDGYERGLKEGRTGGSMRQREADASLVEAGECVCLYLEELLNVVYERTGEWEPILEKLCSEIVTISLPSPPTVTKHAPCCCKALAEQIRSRP